MEKSGEKRDKKPEDDRRPDAAPTNHCRDPLGLSRVVSPHKKRLPLPRGAVFYGEKRQKMLVKKIKELKPL